MKNKSTPEDRLHNRLNNKNRPKGDEGIKDIFNVFSDYHREKSSQSGEMANWWLVGIGGLLFLILLTAIAC